VRRLHLLEALLELLEPRDEQMAVLQKHPVPLGRALLEILLGDGPLTLTERDKLETRHHALLVAQLLDVALRVGARREDEDHWHALGALVVDAVVVEHGRLHEALAHGTHHVELDGVVAAVGTEAPHHTNALQRRELVVVAVGQVDVLRCLEVVPVLPQREMVLKVLAKLVDLRYHLPETEQVLPTRRDEPRRGARARDCVEARVTLEEEVELGPIELARAVLDRDGHLKGEHELVPLEDASARVLVHVGRDGRDHVVEALLEYDVALGAVERRVEHSEE
jgi:hypothetical protein